MKISILHYGAENHYLIGLLTGLNKYDDLVIEIVGSNSSEKLFEWNEKLIHYNLRRSTEPNRSIIKKIITLISFYLRLFFYYCKSDADIYHLQWETKFFCLDRFVFIPLLRLRRKKIIYTAHNVDNYGRGRKKNFLNSATLRFFYSKFDTIIVHTMKVKAEIERRFNIESDKIFVIPHGINILNKKFLSVKKARRYLNISTNKKVMLCFGSVEPYKGFDLLLKSMINLLEVDNTFFLIIAGRCLNKNYLKELEKIITQHNLKPYVKFVNKFIHDDEINYFFCSADVLLLPYRAIYQSGVLFLAYSFGLPIIATDVGSFTEDIIEGKTGFIADKDDIDDLTEKIKYFYNTNLFWKKEETRNYILNYAREKYSWINIGKQTKQLYDRLI